MHLARALPLVAAAVFGWASVAARQQGHVWLDSEGQPLPIRVPSETGSNHAT